MRILLVNDYGVCSGGAEITMRALRACLRRRGHEVRLFTSRARPLPLPLESDYLCFGTTSPMRGVVQSLNPWAARALRRVLAAYDPQIVHVRMFLTQLSPLVLPVLAGRPSLLHVETVRPICPSGSKLLPDGSICTARYGWVCRGCLPVQDWPFLMLQMRLWLHWQSAFDRIVANSHWTRRRLEQDGLRVDEVIWNGVPVVPPRPAPASRPTVAFAGRLAPEKGLEVLLEAFRRVRMQLPDAQLQIAGDGPERALLAARIRALGLEEAVDCLGHRPRSELDARLGAAWVQVVPSLWEEPFGLVAAEAMMRSVAVVASDAGGLAELVENGRTGRLVPRGDPGSLAEALIGILSDRALAERLGRAGRERALAYFDEECLADRFVEVYHALLEGRPS